MSIKVSFISDLHNKHDQWWGRMFERGLLTNYDQSDILVFSGDMSGRGSKYEVEEFMKWFVDQPGTFKVFIPGNHDFYFEDKDRETVIEELNLPDNVYYLNDSGAEIMGLKFWGSPVTPYFRNWAFNRIGSAILDHWNLIPDETDVLVTHGPPNKILDLLDLIYRKPEDMGNFNKGCPYLIDKVKEIEPVVHAFGHIHEGYGMRDTHKEGTGNTCFINASCLNAHYQAENPPVTINVTGKSWK